MGPVRPLLLATTALLVPALAWALALDARPQGGVVVAGQASIAQTTARTQVNQTTNRAVIEWRGFDIGANHQVDIRQPDAASWSLQRVTGPDPSAIAGRLTSNGGVALVNPAGIVFQGGAQVDVAALIATTSDTATESFMAGRMAFEGAPRPGARVENRGAITVRDQGLAALVGPVAANSGTIRARLGRVAVAGGEAFALDMAGDGLLAFDVTRQVTAAPSGAAALATNSGTIEAEGGHVLLTARAASGVLETLVEAGGRIAAAGGSITANAPGGGVRVPAGAQLDASAPQGGGRVTVGAAATSRIGAPEALSARTTVARDATIRADATGRGAGGRVIVHAERRTEMRGTLSARGGAQGGQGGEIEVSSRGALLVEGRLQAGRTGRVLIDPEELHIVETPSGATEPEEIAAATVNTTEGHLILQADRRIRVLAEVNRTEGPLTLETLNQTASPGDGISIEAPLSVLGDLRLRSAGDITQTDGARIAAATLFAESRTAGVRLEASDNAISALDGGFAAGRFDIASAERFSVDAPVSAEAIRLTSREGIALWSGLAADSVELVALGSAGIVQNAGAITAGRLALESPFAEIRLDQPGNRIAALADVTAPAGLALRNAEALRLVGTLNGLDAPVTLRVDGGDLTQDPDASRLLADRLEVAAPGGAVRLEGANNLVTRFAGSARDVLALDAGRTLLLDGTVAAAEVALTAQGDLVQLTDALVRTALLRARAIGGAVQLGDPLNEVAALGDSSADAGFELATIGTLTITGRVAAPTVVLIAGGSLLQDGGAIETGELRALALTGSVALDGVDNRVATLGQSGAAAGFALATAGALEVVGAVDAGGPLALTAEALTLAAPIVAPAVTLRATAGDIVQADGTIATATLRAEATGEVRLAAAGNAILAASGTAGPLFSLRTSGALAVDDIAAAEVALQAGGAITQAAGGLGIAADLLSATAGGRVELAAAANVVPTLGTVVAPGGLMLRTGGGLRLTEAIAVPAAELHVGGDLAQLPGAALSAGTLRLAAGGNVALEAVDNAIPRLLSAEAGGELRLATSGALALDGVVRAGDTVALTAADALTQASGHVEAPVLIARSTFAGVTLAGANLLGAVGGGAAGSWSLRQEGAGTLRLAGLVAAPEVALSTAGGLDDAGGVLRAAVLGLDVAGTALLAGPDHRVGALSGQAGELWLAAGGPVEVTNTLAVGGRLGLSADRIALAAPVSAGSSALLVALAGDVTQSAAGARLAVGAGLEAHAAGVVVLTGAGNQVGRLSAGSAAGEFALATTGPLAVAGAVSGETVALRSAGQMRLDGASFQAGRAVLLAAPGGLAAGAQSTLAPLDPGRLPVLMLDTRAGGLAAIPAEVLPDVPGLAAAQQPTQLAAFGPASSAAAGGLAFDIAAGASPVFLLLDAAPAVGTVEGGRLGVLGQGGSAFLVGVVGGVGGAAAAALVTVSGNNAGYSFNNCPMGLANCGQPPDPPPVDRPAGPAVPFRVGLFGLDAPGGAAEGQDAVPWSPWPAAWPLGPMLRHEE